MLLSRAAKEGSPSDGVLVMGDFNSDEQNPAFQALLADRAVGLRDSFRAMHPNAQVVGTFNSFKGDSTQGKIDAILVNPRLVPMGAGIDRRRFGELWASDHFAVWAAVRRAPR